MSATESNNIAKRSAQRDIFIYTYKIASRDSDVAVQAGSRAGSPDFTGLGLCTRNTGIYTRNICHVCVHVRNQQTQNVQQEIQSMKMRPRICDICRHGMSASLIASFEHMSVAVRSERNESRLFWTHINIRLLTHCQNVVYTLLS